MFQCQEFLVEMLAVGLSLARGKIDEHEWQNRFVNGRLVGKAKHRVESADERMSRDRLGGS